MLPTTHIEGLIPSIRQAELDRAMFTHEILKVQNTLDNLPEVLLLNSQLLSLRKSQREAEIQEDTLRAQASDILVNANMKEITTLDGTTVSLHFSPGYLVVQEGAVIPEEYFTVKTSRDLDKASIKKAIVEGTYKGDDVYIKKDTTLVIKHK